MIFLLSNEVFGVVVRLSVTAMKSCEKKPLCALPDGPFTLAFVGYADRLSGTGRCIYSLLLSKPEDFINLRRYPAEYRFHEEFSEGVAYP